MLAYYKEHWYWAPVLLALLGLAVFMCVKAAQASAKARTQRGKFMQEAAYLNQCAAWFGGLDAQTARVATQEQPRRLLDGAAFLLQKQLENTKNLNTAFSTLPEQAQMVYALHYLLEDAKESLSFFFKQSGKPLTPAANAAMRHIVGGELYAVFKEAYDAWDEDNEEVSLLSEEIQKWDAQFAELLKRHDPLPQIADFICDNLPLLQADILQQSESGHILV